MWFARSSVHLAQLHAEVRALRLVCCRFTEHDTEVVALSFSTDDRLLMSAGHEEK